MKIFFRKYHHVLIFCGLFIKPGLIYSQEWKEDLLAMNKAYISAKSFQMNIEIKSFTTAADTKPLFDYKGRAVSSEGNYYTSIMGRTTIFNKRSVLLVDDKQKIILYKKNKKDAKAQNGFSIAKLDSAMVLAGKNVQVKYLLNSAEEKRIQIAYKNSLIDKLELAINPDNNTIVQVVYYYNTENPEFNNSAAKVTVDYSDIVLNKPIADSYFSENKFITIKKNKITPLNNYAKYQVVDQDQTQTP